MAPVCAHCSQPLEITLDPPSPDEENDDENQDVDVSMEDDDDDDDDDDENNNPQTIPDDVLLPCGDHFHWECLLESYELSTCPACSKTITSFSPTAAMTTTSGGGGGGGSTSSTSHPLPQEPHPQILVTLTNEGGTQHDLDIFPLLREESYLRTFPDERKSRAFLELCREGDHRSIVELLKSCEPSSFPSSPSSLSSSPSKSSQEILRYQDPLSSMQSGLHAAVENGHREVAWLILLLASEYPELEFPALVFQEAAALGVMREEQEGLVDVRGLRDSDGRTAEDLVKEMMREGGGGAAAAGVWNGWVGNGRLALPPRG